MHESALLEWAAKQPGVDGKKFASTYQSFTIQSKAARAKKLTGDYGVTGVPSIVVDGKYITSGAMTGDHQSMLLAVDQLIKKAQQERSAKHKK